MVWTAAGATSAWACGAACGARACCACRCGYAPWMTSFDASRVSPAASWARSSGGSEAVERALEAVLLEGGAQQELVGAQVGAATRQAAGGVDRDRRRRACARRARARASGARCGRRRRSGPAQDGGCATVAPTMPPRQDRPCGRGWRVLRLAAAGSAAAAAPTATSAGSSDCLGGRRRPPPSARLARLRLRRRPARATASGGYGVRAWPALPAPRRRSASA